jgi:hypothetical protein
MVTLTTSALMAGIPISKDYKVTIHDELWMDMAVTVAKDGMKECGIPCGTVIVLNGALKCVGEPTNKATSVETAIAMSRMASLENAVIYTINEPTIEAYNMICRFGADAVYFVNPKEKVIAGAMVSIKDNSISYKDVLKVLVLAFIVIGYLVIMGILLVKSKLVKFKVKRIRKRTN